MILVNTDQSYGHNLQGREVRELTHVIIGLQDQARSGLATAPPTVQVCPAALPASTSQAGTEREPKLSLISFAFSAKQALSNKYFAKYFLRLCSPVL